MSLTAVEMFSEDLLFEYLILSVVSRAFYKFLHPLVGPTFTLWAVFWLHSVQRHFTQNSSDFMQEFFKCTPV